MPRIAVVSHNQEVGEGRLTPHLQRHEVLAVWAPAAEFPERVDAAVVLGGFMGAYQTHQYPWLEDEKQWLRNLAADDVPVLGICLGSQLIADALGGRAYRAPLPEVGVVEVHLTAEGRDHPVVAHLGRRVFLAHQDTFEIPEDATLLAASHEYPIAFQAGTALGLQSHPEVPADQAATWPDHPEFVMLDQRGLDRAEFLRQLEESEADLEAAAEAMFSAWFDGVS